MNDSEQKAARISYYITKLFQDLPDHTVITAQYLETELRSKIVNKLKEEDPSLDWDKIVVIKPDEDHIPGSYTYTFEFGNVLEVGQTIEEIIPNWFKEGLLNFEIDKYLNQGLPNQTKGKAMLNYRPRQKLIHFHTFTPIKNNKMSSVGKLNKKPVGALLIAELGGSYDLKEVLYVASAAFCSPKDEFVYKIANDIVTGRVNTARNNVEESVSKPWFRDIADIFNSDCILPEHTNIYSEKPIQEMSIKQLVDDLMPSGGYLKDAPWRLVDYSKYDELWTKLKSQLLAPDK